MSTKIPISSILVIGPHPDDIEIGCAGLMQKYTFRHITLVTKGEVGGSSIREAEAADSAGVLRASWSCLGLEDTKVSMRDLIPLLESEIAAHHPSVICIPPLLDTHQDHVATHQAALAATRNFRGTVLAYLTPSTASQFRPNWFYELTVEQLELKARALQCHISQRYKLYGSAEYASAVARYWALSSRSDIDYVEPYELIRHMVE